MVARYRKDNGAVRNKTLTKVSDIDFEALEIASKSEDCFSRYFEIKQKNQWKKAIEHLLVYGWPRFKETHPHRQYQNKFLFNHFSNDLAYRVYRRKERGNT